MKKNLPLCLKACFFSWLFISFVAANAQITITSANMPVAGKIYFSARDTNVATTGASGANQQWDFSAWSVHEIDTSYFADPTTMPGYSSFPNSNLGLMQSGSGNIFLNNSSSALDILGFYGDLGFGPQAAPFTPEQRFISFPGTYQSTFSGTSKIIIEGPYQQPPIDSVRIVSTTNYSSEMDAWGTLTTPSYSNINCLRQKYTEIKTDSTYVHMFGAWSPAGSPTIDTTVTYRWWSDTEEFIIAEIQTDGSGNLAYGSYLTAPRPRHRFPLPQIP